MKPKSAAGVLCVVSDLDKTVEFYEKLGFDFKNRTPDYATGYINWYWIEFVPFEKVEPSLFKKLEKDNIEPKGAGIFMHFSVDDVDDYYQKVIKANFKPSGEPRDWPWGRREFVLRDPDGYKLVFFQKTK